MGIEAAKTQAQDLAAGEFNAVSRGAEGVAIMALPVVGRRLASGGGDGARMDRGQEVRRSMHTWLNEPEQTDCGTTRRPIESACRRDSSAQRRFGRPPGERCSESPRHVRLCGVRAICRTVDLLFRLRPRGKPVAGIGPAHLNSRTWIALGRLFS